MSRVHTANCPYDGPEGVWGCTCGVLLSATFALIDAMQPMQRAGAYTDAPSLLEACEAALEFAEDQEDVDDGDYGQPQANRAMQVATMLRAAIAKAEGK